MLFHDSINFIYSRLTDSEVVDETQAPPAVTMSEVVMVKS